MGSPYGRVYVGSRGLLRNNIFTAHAHSINTMTRPFTRHGLRSAEAALVRVAASAVAQVSKSRARSLFDTATGCPWTATCSESSRASSAPEDALIQPRACWSRQRRREQSEQQRRCRQPPPPPPPPRPTRQKQQQQNEQPSAKQRTTRCGQRGRVRGHHATSSVCSSGFSARSQPHHSP